MEHSLSVRNVGASLSYSVSGLHLLHEHVAHSSCHVPAQQGLHPYCFGPVHTFTFPSQLGGAYFGKPVLPQYLQPPLCTLRMQHRFPDTDNMLASSSPRVAAKEAARAGWKKEAARAGWKRKGNYKGGEKSVIFDRLRILYRL